MTQPILPAVLQRRARWLQGIAARIERDDVAEVVMQLSQATKEQARRQRWPSGLSRYRQVSRSA